MDDEGQSKEELERLKLFYEIRKLITDEEKARKEIEDRFWYRAGLTGGLIAGIGTAIAGAVKLLGLG